MGQFLARGSFALQVTFCTLGLPGSSTAQELEGRAGADAAGGEFDVERVVEALELREEALSRISLPFVTSVSPDAIGPGAPPDPDELWTVRGRWSRDGERVALRLERRPPPWIDPRPVRRIHATRDEAGVRLLEFTNSETIAAAESAGDPDPPAATLEIHDDPWSGPFRDDSFPGGFTTMRYHTPWSRNLELFLEFRVEGEEVVAGHPCTRLLLDIGDPEGAQPETIQSPLRIWIDTRETLLILRAQEFSATTPANLNLIGFREEPGDMSAEELESVVEVIDGVRWLTWIRKEALDTTEIAPGFHLESKFRIGVHWRPRQASLVSLVVEEVEIGRDAGAGQFELELPESTFVDDRVRGESYRTDRDSQSEYQEDFRALFEGWTGQASDAAPPLDPRRCTETSCGIDALVLMAMVRGIEVSIPELLDQVPLAELDQGEVSVRTLVEVGREVGIELMPISGAASGLVGRPGSAICQVSNRDSLHWCVVSSTEDGQLRVANPPHRAIRSYTPEEFDRISTGVFLLDGSSGGFVDGDEDGIRFVVLALLSAVCAAGAFRWATRTRRNAGAIRESPSA